MRIDNARLYSASIENGAQATGSLLVSGSMTVDGLVTATSFSGDGSSLTGVTGDWDGTRDGDAEITGSLIITQALTASGVISGSTILGERIDASLRVETSQINQAGDTLDIYGAANVVGSLTASIVSASGDLIGNGLTIGGSTGPIQVFDDPFILKLGSGSAGGSNATLRSSDKRLLVNSGGGFDTFEVQNTNNFTVDTTGNVTASGNISASGDLRADTLRVGVTSDNTDGLFISASTFDGDTRDVQIIYPNHGLHFNDNSGNNHVLALASNNVGVRIQPDGNAALTVSGSVNVIDGNITASGDISGSASSTGSFGSMVLTSPDGTAYLLTVNNDGHFSLTGSAV